MPTVHATAMGRRPEGIGLLLRMLSCIRFDEVLLLQGSPLFGAMFSMGPMAIAKWSRVLVFAAASSCLVAHVFVLNDWCGMSTDLRDPYRAHWVFTAKGLGRREIGYLAALLLAFSLLLLVPFGSQALLIAVAISILSALYSGPVLPLKGVPLLSSALHFIGGLLHFLLGYALFSALDPRGIAIGCFFALTFVAGHLTHEARDHESDLRNGIMTNAVKFGRARIFAAGFIGFTVADILLVMLSVNGVVPRAVLSVALLYPLHLWWTLQILRTGLTFENIRRLQGRYRSLYAIVGLIMIAASLSSR
jgi:4-hydroxybenzoate polyprenyltransferase